MDCLRKRIIIRYALESPISPPDAAKHVRVERPSNALARFHAPRAAYFSRRRAGGGRLPGGPHVWLEGWDDVRGLWLLETSKRVEVLVPSERACPSQFQEKHMPFARSHAI